jgi:hypothetical protein
MRTYACTRKWSPDVTSLPQNNDFLNLDTLYFNFIYQKHYYYVKLVDYRMKNNNIQNQHWWESSVNTIFFFTFPAESYI